jgi:AraC family transcriptional regulator
MDSLGREGDFFFHGCSNFARKKRLITMTAQGQMPSPLRVTSYTPASTMAAHYHEEPSLIVVVGGSYRESIHASETDHIPGSMLFYPAFAAHSQRFGGTGARKIVFTPQASSLEFLQSRGISSEAPRHMRSPAVLRLASHLLAEMRHQDEFAPLALDGIVLELVAAFARGERTDGGSQAPPWVRAARNLIHEKCGGSDSLEDIAVCVGRHPVHLAREFRRHFGASIGEYRRRLRVEKAAGMLRRRNVDLTEIALDCGFASHSHLCRSFKAAYGMTPSEYRSSV